MGVIDVLDLGFPCGAFAGYADATAFQARPTHQMQQPQALFVLGEYAELTRHLSAILKLMLHLGLERRKERVAPFLADLDRERDAAFGILDLGLHGQAL